MLSFSQFLLFARSLFVLVCVAPIYTHMVLLKQCTWWTSYSLFKVINKHGQNVKEIFDIFIICEMFLFAYAILMIMFIGFNRYCLLSMAFSYLVVINKNHIIYRFNDFRGC